MSDLLTNGWLTEMSSDNECWINKLTAYHATWRYILDFGNINKHSIWTNSIHITSSRAISIKTHFYNAWSFCYEDGCTEGTVLCQGPKTVHNYCNDNSQFYIINQPLLYVQPKIPLKFQREMIKNIPWKTPTVNRKFLEGLHTNTIRWQSSQNNFFFH